jgi:hypothetical protein
VAMTELGQTSIINTFGQMCGMFYLNEAGIAAAASSTVSVTWSTTPTEVLLSHAMFANTFQQKPPTNGVLATVGSATSLAYSGYYNYLNNLIICVSSYGNPLYVMSVSAGLHSVGIQVNGSIHSSFTSYVVPALNQTDTVTHSGGTSTRWAGVVGVFDNISNYPILDISGNDRNVVSNRRPRHQVDALR